LDRYAILSSMKTLDGRSIDPKAMEQIRIRAVQRVQEGESPEVVIKTLGFARACIYNWLARYRAGGWDGLKTGKHTGRPKKLSAKHIAWVYRIVSGSNPKQLQFPFMLWTRAMIAKAIRRKFGIKLSVTSVGRLLHQLGFTCQRPLYRAYQQDPEAVAHWKKHVFPEIKKQAKKEGAVIYFEDESGVRSDFHSGRTWALKGQTPVIESTGSRFRLNMIAAISTRGLMRFMTVDTTVGAEQICEFLKRLMHDHNQPVFLIWDGLPAHRSGKVKTLIESFEGRLKVFTLPSYSPELNPTEQVWNHAKTHGIGRKVAFGPDQLKTAVLGRLRKLQNLPGIICSFFKHPECRYILV